MRTQPVEPTTSDSSSPGIASALTRPSRTWITRSAIAAEPMS